MSRIKNAILIDTRDGGISLRVDMPPKVFIQVLKDSQTMAKECAHKHNWRYFINYMINNYEGHASSNKRIYWIDKPLTHHKGVMLCLR